MSEPSGPVEAARGPARADALRALQGNLAILVVVNEQKQGGIARRDERRGRAAIQVVPRHAVALFHAKARLRADRLG